MREKKQTTSALEMLRRRVNEGGPDRIAERDQTHREMALGMKIQAIREAQGMTQKDLADKIGTQPSAISRIEDADYDRHSISVLQKVADALDMLLLIDFAPKHPKARPRKGQPSKKMTRMMR
jgi:ribosome-binding protein aMBF1 (putative translation factor)